MTQKNDFDDTVDPRLQQLLDKLHATPARDAQSADRGRTRYLAQLDALGLSRPKSRVQDLLGWLTLNNITNQRSIRKDENFMATRIPKIAVITAVVLMAVMLLVVSGGAMTAYASRAAMPGDALYTVKTGIERTEVTFSKSPAVQAELHLQFAQKRLDEMSALIKEGRFSNVSKTSTQFEYHVQQAVILLQIVAAGNPTQASALTTQVSTTLTRYTQTLNTMLTNVPETTRSSMTRAIQVSSSGSTFRLNESGEVEFTGTVETITPTSWTVSGRVLTVAPETQIEGVINVGDLVEVSAFTASDGTLTAHKIRLEEEGNANSNDNQNGNENENDNDNENENANSNDQHHDKVEFSGTVESITPTSWTVSGRVLAIAPETQIKGVINVGDLVEVSAYTAADGSLTAHKIRLEEEGNANSNDNQNGNENENDNDNENENANSNDQHHDKVEFSGAVEAISSESWTIAGRTVAITPSTEIEGSIVVGSQVEVKAMTNADGTLTALKIKLSEDHEGNFNENTNSNTNSNENGNHNSNENDNENDNEGNHNSNMNHNGNGNGNDNGGEDDD